MIKKELRSIYKEKRLAIPSTEKLKLDDLMLLQFQQLYFDEAAEVLLTYWPMANMSEPNMLLYTSYLRHTVPNLQIAYPVADFATGQMKAVLIDEDTVYTTNTHGITEPKEGLVIQPDEIDIAFVPLLACDGDGIRVGYGKGFYDRYLRQCRQDIISIGFSYFEPVDKIEDANEFDVPLNYCITPQNIYEF
jgi:5-formyltetrahydrofolate cyclo-ligase